MPTQLHNPSQSTRERYFARQATYRLAGQTRQLETITSPWLGWVPDLPPYRAGWHGYRDGRGFIPLAHAGRGEFLRHDDGYRRIDEDNMVEGSSPLAADVGAPLLHPAWEARGITMLAQYVDGGNPPARQRIAIVSGLETAQAAPWVNGTYILMARLSGAGAWTDMDPEAGWAATGPPTTIPLGNREALWDWAIFPYGVTSRNNFTGAVTITVPVLVACNADEDGPVDPVIVTPSGDAAPAEYDCLQCDGAVTPAPEFRATSVESFDGRLHFLATVEGGTDELQRHRWTGVGTANVDESIVGSGYLDLVEFQKRGLRIESLQNKLALYYEDGVAFQVPTGFYADAYRPQIISRTRGLIGTHALVAISPELHFGIFNDGWFFLDPSGRWSEAGTLILEETKGKRYELTKWKQTFYDELDDERKHRTVVTYDNFRKLIRIAYTARGTSDNSTILNYHWPTDSVWRDYYGNALTMWGSFDQQIREAEQWGPDFDPPGKVAVTNPIDPGNPQTLTWADVTGTWADYSAQFVDEALVHGHVNGLVFQRDYNLTTYDGSAIFCQYTTHQYNRNQDPLKVTTFSRFGVEYMNVSANINLSIQAQSDEASLMQGQILSLQEGTPNTIQNSYAHFRLQGTELGFSVATFSPIAIRSFIPELLHYVADDREGQS